MDQDHAKVVETVRPWLLADAAYTAPPSITAGENQVRELTDTIACIVDREINGIYELTMQYPVTGKLYSEISVRSLIYVNPDEDTARQLFRIYRISKPIFGVVTIYARHISYDLGGYVCPPFTASGIAAALAGITANTEPSPCPFVFSSTRTTASTFTVTVPCDIWALMAGQAGSLLDVYGGEYTFDNFSVTLENSVGADNGVTIEYAKNLTQLLQDEDGGSMYTGIYPYYYTEESGLVQLPEKVVDGPTVWPFSVYKAVDMTDKFQSVPTQAQLRTAAQNYVANNDIGSPKMSLDVDFIPLWQTEEYKGDVKERVSLGDTVTIKYSALGVNATARVMATRYNCLKEKYDKLTVGSIRADLGTIIKDTAQSSVQSVQPGAPVATKGAVTNHAVVITPSVTNVGGYIVGGAHTGTPVTVTASELVSGNLPITANGNNIDVTNYETVSVNVPTGGGAANLITGTFTTPSASGAHTLTLPYTGSGYPIALFVFVADGEYTSGSDWYNAIKRYAIGQFTIAKSNTQIAPSYGTSGAANQGVTSWIYKSSTSSATSYSRSSAMNTNSFSSSNATSTAAQVCRFRSATQLSYYVIGSSNYGLMPETEYRYIAFYSS